MTDHVSRKGTDPPLYILLLSSYTIMIPLFPILLLFLKQIHDISCWKKTARNTFGMVCISRIPCETMFSYRIRIRVSLFGYNDFILHVDWSTYYIYSYYYVQ